MASTRNIGKLVNQIKNLDAKLLDDIYQIFDNDENYPTLKGIVTYCHGRQAKSKDAKVKRQQLLISAIKSNNIVALAVMMKATYSPNLTELLFKESYLGSGIYINAEELTPLFFALELGQFEIARYILSYLKNCLDITENIDLIKQYVTNVTQKDPLYIAHQYLKKKNITSEQREDCQLFIDQFFSLLPTVFFKKNPIIFRLWGLVDFYTFMLDQAPKEFIKSLEEKALPESALRPAAFNLLCLSINRKLYPLFDLLVAALPDYFSDRYTKDGNGDTLLHHAVYDEDAYFTFKLLTSGADQMLNIQNNRGETPLMIALTVNLKNYLLCKLYRDGYHFYSLFSQFLDEQITRLADLPDLLSLFRPSKIQGLRAALTKLDTPDKFLSNFFRLIDLSDADPSLEGAALLKYITEKICGVNFTYMNGEKPVSTSIGEVLGQNRFNPFATSMSFQYLNSGINTELHR